jgi:DNA-binding HxlR family transcriptional regulator
LLIIRDMMLLGSRTFKELLNSYERPATNILTERLRRLESFGILTTESDASDGRKVVYELTQKGVDLAPVLTEMVLWAAAHEETENEPLVRQMKKDKEAFVAGIRQRFALKLRK